MGDFFKSLLLSQNIQTLKKEKKSSTVDMYRMSIAYLAEILRTLNMYKSSIDHTTMTVQSKLFVGVENLFCKYINVFVK